MKKVFSVTIIAFLTIIINPLIANANMSVGQMVGSGIIEPPQAPSLEPRTGPIARDGSYAIVDSHGSVTNIVVCDIYCANGTFGPGGDLAVIQIPNSNSGIWFGPGTTTYDIDSGMFTAIESEPTEITEEIDGVVVKTTGRKGIKFFGGNLFFSGGITPTWSLDSTADLSTNNTSEFLPLGNRKTEEQTVNIVANSGLLELNSKIDTVLLLLKDWVK